MEWITAPDVTDQINRLIPLLGFSHIDSAKIICFRSHGSKARMRARIWSFPKVWQLALHLPPHYVIEVNSKLFDHLSDTDKKKVLIHELMHIPKTFSGSLVPHKHRGGSIDRRSVDKLFNRIFHV